MKKHFLFLSAAAALLSVGCTTSDEVATTPSQAQSDAPTAVQFGTYMGRQDVTRAGTAGAISDASLKTGTHATSGFGVFAYNTGAGTWSSAGTSTAPNFMYNQKVYYETSDWKYEPLKYWPNGIDAGNTSGTPSNTATQSGVQNVSFFAYAPYIPVTVGTGAPTGTATEGITALTTNAANGDPKVTYKFHYTGGAGSEVYDLGTTNNVDLLWGVRGQATYQEADGSNNTVDLTTDQYNVDLTKQTTTEKVKFLFKHALAKLGGYEGTASGIKVVADVDANETSNPKTTGAGTLDANTLITLNSITIANGEASSTSTFKNGGVFNLAKGTWDTSSAEKITFSKEYTNSDLTGKNTAVWEPSSAPTWVYRMEYQWCEDWNRSGCVYYCYRCLIFYS